MLGQGVYVIAAGCTVRKEIPRRKGAERQTKQSATGSNHVSDRRCGDALFQEAGSLSAPRRLVRKANLALQVGGNTAS